MATSFPIDNQNLDPTAQRVLLPADTHQRHVERAMQIPRFDAARAEIAASQAASHATLRDLRKSLELTQLTVAEAMGMSQSELSRVERRDDIFLSTLGRFVSATGGRLTLTVEYEDRDPITLGLRALTHTATT